ncbi:MAG: hypothetical protein UX67_C0034G0011 [Candidatus Woesebacteria bacterium GW2011_GWF2_46_8]|uniref:Uncharacterized protein n=1 Tax=Candidatus Woesebacteria bacterium GW2011_GWF2_46_8 TaxID=1618604 RepID=A0A0G1QRC2_9BACT|nr:MAG: hypothetical protein UX67_C0034G0011 [Candidatus Woesebacteria bacterium GW2011_GWF2_46_8]
MRDSESDVRLISGGESLVIEPQDGQAVIARAEKIFKEIDADFRKWELDRHGKRTDTILVDVYELVSDAVFLDMFSCISLEWDKLVMTQSQVIWFCRKYPKWIRRIHPTLFLMDEFDDYYIASIRYYRPDLHAGVFHFSYDYNWKSKYPPRIVVPHR